MAIKGEKQGEKIFRWCVHAGAIVIALIVLITGFLVKQPCDLDKIYLWCRVHPVQAQDIFGLIFFFGGALGTSGIWLLLIGDVDQNPGRLITYGSGVLMIFGFLLMWV